jgi:anti-sigma B factor antagonist
MNPTTNFYDISAHEYAQIIHIYNLSNPLDNQQITTEISELLVQKNRNFIIALDSLNFLNSTGLNLLINALTRVRNLGGELIITGISTQMRQVFVLTKLQNMFLTKPTLEEGLEFFKNRAQKTE